MSGNIIPYQISIVSTLNAFLKHNCLSHQLLLISEVHASVIQRLE